MSRVLIAAATAALVVACSPAQPDPAAETETPTAAPAAEPSAGETMTAPAAAEFVRMAGASDLYEIQSSETVLETTQNADVRAFAQMMIENHGQTTAAIKAAAQQANMSPPDPALDPAKTALIAELRAAQGEARDRAYVNQQVTAHEEALALHRAYSQGGDQEALRAASASAVPVVERHLTEIRRIQSAM